MPAPSSRRGSECRQESVSAAGPNVLVVGEAGTGKSSVVNLIAGKELAKVDSGAGGCTLEATSYDILLPDHRGPSHQIRLYDTVGVNEAQLQQFRKKSYLLAIEKANTLICQLQKAGGIQLLLFCFRGCRITATTQRNFALFCDILCQKKVSVALIITGTENERPMEMWWQKNESMVKDYGLSCTSHVCVTATRGPEDRFAKEYDESQEKVRDMLLKNATEDGLAWQTDRTSWFTSVARKLLGWLKGDQALKKEELARHLRVKCGFLQSEAMYLAEKILAEQQENASPQLLELYASHNSQSLHAILFGGRGVGKSSVVNLIAGYNLAETSSDAGTRTSITKPYRIVLQGDRSFCLWDTIGLAEPDISLDDYLCTIKQAYKLIKEIESRGGVYLLLFCMRGGSIGGSSEQNYKLFVKALCRDKVPAYIVVTGLEGEQRMDDWWTANVGMLRGRGIVPDGHACITAKSSPGFGHMRSKYHKESRQRMCNLLLESKPKPSNESAMQPVQSLMPDRRLGLKKLVEQCGFSNTTADAIATSIEEIDRLPPGSDESGGLV